jgi:hypothetical protein
MNLKPNAEAMGAQDMNEHRLAVMIGAVVCAAVFPIVLFVVFLIENGIAASLGFNTNPVAGIMYLSIAMTYAFPALLVCMLILGLPIIHLARNERALRSMTIVICGALTSFAIAAGSMYCVGAFDIRGVLAAINVIS